MNENALSEKDEFHALNNKETNPDDAVYKLQEKLASISKVESDPEYFELLEVFKNGKPDYSVPLDKRPKSVRYEAFMEIRRLIDDEYDIIPECILNLVSDKNLTLSSTITGNELFDALLNGAFSNDSIFQELQFGMPYHWRKAKGDRSDPVGIEKSSLKSVNSSITNRFPAADKLRDFLSRPDTYDMTDMRKLLIFLHFSDTFLSYLFNGFENEPLETRYNRYINFKSSLDSMLESCNMVCSYPGDPYDWLILKSAVSFLRIGRDETSPIEYFNRVIWMSYDEFYRYSMNTDGEYHPEHAEISMV